MGPCVPAPGSSLPRLGRRSEDLTDKRLLLALVPLALLVACGDGAAEGERATSGEVLEGTISDAMLPVDTVRSEPPLEDPEAFAKAQSGAEASEGQAPPGAEDAAAEAGEGTADEPAASAPPSEEE